MSGLGNRMTSLSAGTDSPPAVPTLPPSKPISMSVAVKPATYKELKAWPDQVGLPMRLGKARVPTNTIISALIAELLEDKGLQAVIAERIVEMER